MAKQKKSKAEESLEKSGFTNQAKKHIQMRIRDFKIPIVRDIVVVGAGSPIGPEAMNRALGLMNGRPFERIDVNDATVAAIIVRRDILKRLPIDELKVLILESVKNLMSPHEVMMIDIDAELEVEIKR